MHRISIITLAVLFFIQTYSFNTLGQNKYGLVDGLGNTYCNHCRQLIAEKPKEVLFGIDFKDGNIFFSITSRVWFDKFFTNADDGVAVDIVSKDQFKCGTDYKQSLWYRGYVLSPIYLPDLKKGMYEEANGNIRIKIGSIPQALIGKEIEGNLIFVRNDKVCFYTNFTNIDRSSWQLLGMGLYADSLVEPEKNRSLEDTGKQVYYSKKSTLIIPFAGGEAILAESVKKSLIKLFESENYKVKKITIRALSSVDGTQKSNEELENQRAQSIVKFISHSQKTQPVAEINTGEDWVEFMEDIQKSPQAYLMKLPKDAIRKKLNEKSLLDSLKSILIKERKAIVTVFLSPRSLVDDISNQQILNSFNSSVKEKNLSKASSILRSIFDRISDNTLPSDFLNKIQIPMEKPCVNLLNEDISYMVMLEQVREEEAIFQLKKIEELDSANSKVKYNLCVLSMHLWQRNSKYLDKGLFLKQINMLSRYGINTSLINRMLINYNILLCEIFLKEQKFEEKDAALEKIMKNYIDKYLSDNDLYCLGKYFCYYSQFGWADEFINPRVNKLDVNEDLLFFYINLSIIRSQNFLGVNDKMLLNAITINRSRFCRFFNSIDKGGITMQLLLEPFWKKMYCESCRSLSE